MLKKSDAAIAVSTQEALSQALVLIRTGRQARAEEIVGGIQWNGPFDPQNLHAVRYATLLAEIADYRCRYPAAQDALAKLEPIALEVLRSAGDRVPDLEFKNRKDPKWRLLRQQLFYVWQVSVAEYRNHHDREAGALLTAAIRYAEAMAPPPEGLLTQLYYALAKLRTRERRFADATTLFRQSLVHAAGRFAEAADATGEKRDREREASQYNIGKAMALGLGQCFLEQGRLEEAHTVVIAGLLLLEQTEDDVHRHYARLLLGTIEVASWTPDSETSLDSTRRHLETAYDFFLRTQIGLAFRAMAQLAQMELDRDDLDAAEQRLQDLFRAANRKNKPKWEAYAQIGLAEAAIRRNNREKVLHHLNIAEGIAKQHKLASTAIEARTVRVAAAFETLKEPDRDTLLQAKRDLLLLLDEISDVDYRLRVVPLLLNARVLNLLGDTRRALESFQIYDSIKDRVQLPRVRKLADLVRNELFPSGGDFVCPADRKHNPSFDVDENLEELRLHLAQKVLQTHPGSPRKKYEELLGRDRTWLNEYENTLEKLGRLHRTKKPPSMRSTKQR